MKRVVLAFLLLAGCASPGPQQTVAETKLGAARHDQLSDAAAAVDAAKVANSANPEGLPKAAVAGELDVASRNLPRASQSDAVAALERVSAALAGKLAEAQKGWAAEATQADTRNGRIADLENQLVAERAANVSARRADIERLCVRSALGAAGLFMVLAGLCLLGGLNLSLKPLLICAAGFALCGLGAFFAASQVGTPRFDAIALSVLAVAGLGIVYLLWWAFRGGATARSEAGTLQQVVTAVEGWKKQHSGSFSSPAVQDLLDRLSRGLDRDEKQTISRIRGNNAPAAKTANS